MKAQKEWREVDVVLRQIDTIHYRLRLFKQAADRVILARLEAKYIEKSIAYHLALEVAEQPIVWRDKP